MIVYDVKQYLKKFLSYGVNKNFVSLLKNMCENIKSNVRLPRSMPEFFP